MCLAILVLILYSAYPELGKQQIIALNIPELEFVSKKMQQVTKVPEKLLSYAVRCKNLTVSNARTVLLTPEIYISQNVYEQLLDLLLEAVNRARMSSQLHSHFWDGEFYIFFSAKNPH